MQVSPRNLSAWLVAKLLIMSGQVRHATKKALNGDYILSIYFHKPSKKEFESCIRWLKKNKFHFLSTKDLEGIIYDGLPFPKGGVLLTVDDGWQSNEANIVSVANKYSVPVTIFVSTAPVEEGRFWWSYWLSNNAYFVRKNSALAALKKVSNKERLLKVEEMKKGAPVKRDAMTIEQVRNAARSRYVTIGGHTHTHPILINCDEEEVRSEFLVSKQKLESWTGREVHYVAYPNGDFSKREIRILNDLNCRLAFCSQPTYLTPDRLKARFSLPRFGFLEGASFAENICRIVGIWKPSINRLKHFSLKGKRFQKLFTFLDKESSNAVCDFPT